MRTGFVKVEKGAFGSKEIPEDQLPVHLEYGWTLVSAEPPTPKEILSKVVTTTQSGTDKDGLHVYKVKAGPLKAKYAPNTGGQPAKGILQSDETPTRKPKKSGK